MPTLDDTNSYVTYAELQDYCDLTGRTAPAQASVEPRLIQATLYVDRKYGGRFLGRKVDSDQPLQWPRAATYTRTIDLPDGFYTQDADGNYRDFNVIPREVKEATSEVALGLLTGSNVYAQDSAAVTEETKKVDVLQTTYKYAGNWQPKNQLDFTVDLILRPLLLPAGPKIRFTA